MTNEDYIEAVRANDPKNIILECKTDDAGNKNKRIVIYKFKDGVIARYESISRDAYLSGIVYSTQPKEEIKIIEPIEKVIYKTDWLSDYFKERDEYEKG